MIAKTFLAVLAATGAVWCAAAAVTADRLRQLPPHPRLFDGGRGFELLRRNARLPQGRELATRILYDAGKMCDYPPEQRKLTGRRLLEVSRNVLFRVNTLTTAWVLTGDRKFADRATAELLAAAAFSDWNPAHFLDVAEMTLALALGYDRLYSELTPEQRTVLARAIREKGLKPSLGKHWWVAGSNNWTQVCHAGLTAGALVTAEDDPELAADIINRALVNLPRVMKKSYAPNGAYPEGPMYWSYGTEFNVLLLALLERTLGSDFGLAGQPGFARTGAYLSAMHGNTGQPFSYADAGSSPVFGYANIFLIKYFHQPELFSRTQSEQFLRRNAARPESVQFHGDRLLPLALYELDGLPERPSDRSPGSYSSGKEAAVPVTVHRNRTSYVGIKGGSPSGPHGHMDGGSFIFESDGVRWFHDLGAEDYTRLEQRGLDLWNMSQNSDRWTVFRLGIQSHNLPVIARQRQQVKGSARLRSCNDQVSEFDLSTLYRGQADTVRRRWQLEDSGRLRLREQLTGLKPGVPVEFQFLTRARPTVNADGSLKLEEAGRSLRIDVAGTLPYRWDSVETRELEQEFDRPNPGFRLLRLQLSSPADGKLELTLTLTPGTVRSTP